uniref:Deacetylase sirtuin-type domain-containing protein n=1 Tax=Kalanchoe fedtschenkoi TaxID=63787 RepID=A0A7N0TX14_KALFE
MAIGAYSRLLSPRLRTASHVIGSATTDSIQSSSKTSYPLAGNRGLLPSLLSERHIVTLTVGFKYFGGEKRPVFNFGPPKGKGVSVGLKRKVVPHSDPPSSEDVSNLRKFMDQSNRLVVLTGAGISTESGVPDYRGPNGLIGSGFRPMTHQEFIRSSRARRRFWVRSFVGWNEFTASKPNGAHIAIASLEKAGRINSVITQNYDRLHHHAGSNPLELHGTMYNVICLDCGHSYSRDLFQYRLKDFNPKWAAALESLKITGSDLDKTYGIKRRSGGGLEIDENFWAEEFCVPNCDKCSGVLKPDFLFHGEDVPKHRYDEAIEMAKGCDAFLVLGSSLVNASASTLVRAAHEAGAATAIVNIGKTGADSFVPLKIHSRIGEILSKVLDK